MLGLLVALLAIDAPAKPTGADLLTACEAALASNFRGRQAQMCTWYVTPCDCSLGTSEATPRVCLPETFEVGALAREVLTVLQAVPELQTRAASAAAADILSELYPCE